MKREDRLFLMGLVALVCSLFLFPFVAYLFPAVWLGWKYSMPNFVLDTTLWIEVTFNTTYTMALLAAVFFGVTAYLIAHHMSQLQAKLDSTEEAPQMARSVSTQAKQNSKEGVLFFLKMVVIIALVFIVSDVIQWAISFSPEAR